MPIARLSPAHNRALPSITVDASVLTLFPKTDSTAFSTDKVPLKMEVVDAAGTTATLVVAKAPAEKNAFLLKRVTAGKAYRIAGLQVVQKSTHDHGGHRYSLSASEATTYDELVDFKSLPIATLHTPIKSVHQQAGDSKKTVCTVFAFITSVTQNDTSADITLQDGAGEKDKITVRRSVAARSTVLSDALTPAT